MRQGLRSPKRAKVSQRHTSKPRQSAFGLPPYHCRLGFEALEDRRLLNGLTLITHGFGDNASGWVTSMANQVVDEISSRFGCSVTDVAQVKLTVNSNLTVTPTWIHQSNLGTSKCAETVVLLDWSAVAGNWFSATFFGTISSTVDVAAAVAPCLYEPLSALGLNVPLAQGPIQLIGHSRGGSLVGELAKDLGKQGLWVDQVTTLNAHPLTNTGLDWALVPGVTDAPMTAWNNVVFWDNYWETTFAYPHGQWIPGACNDPGGNFGDANADAPLTFPSGGYPTYVGGSHNDVHLWYQGTVDTTDNPVSDGSGYSFNSQTGGWYGGLNPPQTTSGYYFSRIDGGDRTSSAASDGLLWDDAGSRTPVNLTVPQGSAWDNVEITSLPQDITLNQGTSLPLNLKYEAFGSTQITVGFDTDANPYDGTMNGLQWSVSAPSSNGSIFSSANTSLSTGGLTPGTSYYVYAKITNGGNTCYYYATGAVYVNPPAHQPPSIGSLSASPNPVVRGNNLTLTAYSVIGNGGTVVAVGFYRDTNGNGSIERGTDQLLGLGTQSGTTWTWTGSTSGFPTGTNTYMARAEDIDYAYSNTVTATGTVNSLTSTTLTVTAPNGGETWQAGSSYSVNWSIGGDASAVSYEAVAISTNGGAYQLISSALVGSSRSFSFTPTSNEVSTSAMILVWACDSANDILAFDTSNSTFTIENPVVPPALSVSPTSVTLPTTTLGSSGATASFTVTGTGLGSSDAVLLGAPTGCEISLSSSSGFGNLVWLYPNASGGLPTTTVYARISASATANVNGYLNVTDGLDGSLDQLLPVSGSVQPVHQPPTIASLSVSPDPVIQGNGLTLTANNVNDVDGTVVGIDLYIESNGQSGLQTGAGGDTFLGTGTQSGNNWLWNGSTTSFPLGTNTYYARAWDNDYALSNLVSTTGTVTGPPQIEVEGWWQGNAENVLSVQNPGWGDGTYFGTVTQNSTPPTRTYTVQNTGTGPLTLGTPTVPSGFTIIEPLTGPIAPGGSDDFTVQMSTSTIGTPSGNISFTNNDAAESPFSFAISGTVTYAGAIPTMTVLNVSPSSAVYGQPVTLAAEVGVMPPADGLPSGGTVTFMAGTNVLGSTQLNNGVATLTTTSLAVGVQSVTAIYSGDGSNHAGSTSSSGSSNLIISTVAGGGGFGYGGDGGPATAASLMWPYGFAVDSSGNFFIADTSNCVVREVNHATGLISTIAGIYGSQGYNGDNIQATSAELNVPDAVAVDAGGHFLFIADSGNMRIREVNLLTGIITTVAGKGTYDPPLGDNGPATAASLCVPNGVAVDGSGNLFIVDTQNNRIREVNLTGSAEVVNGVSLPTGYITTVAGGGTGGLGDGGAATAASLSYPTGVVVDASGNLYIADSGDNRVRKVDHTTRKISTVAGNGSAASSGNGGAATSASLNDPCSVAIDASGNLLISEGYGDRIRKVDLSTQTISTFAGGAGTFWEDGPALATWIYPEQLAVDAGGNVYVADWQSCRIRKIAPGNTSVNITPATLTVTADSKNRVYGTTNPALTATVSGFQNGETLANSGVTGSPSLSCAATTTTPVGNYTIATALGTMAAQNYNFIVVNGTFNVTPATLTVAAENESRIYGDPNPTFTANYSGFVNGETLATSGVTGSPSLTCSATSTSAVGNYAIVGSPGTLSGQNYNFTLVNGVIDVVPATLTVATDNKNRIYGDPIPTFTASYSGFKNGEGLATSGMTGSPAFTSPATSDSPVGNYTIVIAPGTLAAGNYNFSFVNGTLTVSPEVISVNSTQTMDSLEASGNVQVTIGSGGDLTVNNPIILDSGGAVSVVQSGRVTVPGVNSQTGAIGIDLNSGTLRASVNFTTSAPMTIGTGGGTIDDNGKSLVIAGALTGPGGLTKTGAGIVTLSGANNYKGGTVVSAGTLIVTVASALPSGTSLTIGAGAAFIFNPTSSATTADLTTASNATSAAMSSDTNVATAVPSSTSPASSSLKSLVPTVADVSASASVAMPGSVPVSDSAGDSRVQSPIIVATPPIAMPLPLPTSIPQTKNLKESVPVIVLGPPAADRVVWSSTAKSLFQNVLPSPATPRPQAGRGSYVGDLTWLGQSTNSSDSSDPQRKKDVAILALDAVFAQYGQ